MDNSFDLYAEYQRVRKKLDIEIANAVIIHKRSLPSILPDTENISFASLYIPAEELGGDLYDVFKVDNGLLDEYFDQYVCYIADVSGHGLDSALLAMFVKDTIRSFFRLRHSPGQVLSPKEIMDFFVEQYIKEGYPGEYLVCIYIIVFDLKAKELTYCNAGLHKCPLLIKEGGNIIDMDKTGLPVSTGLPADSLKYEDTSLPISPDTTLFIMSDGLPEQRSVDAGFYEDRLRKLAGKIYKLSPNDIVQTVLDDFNQFLGFGRILDDITLVVAKM